MRILTAEAMQGVDTAAIEEIGIPGMVLMENAAIGLMEALAENFPAAETVAVFCGPGNNGGDGFALARHLHSRGYGVEIFLLSGRKHPAGDAGRQLEICRRLGLEVTEVPDEAALGLALASARETDLVVDALFGTGLGRPLEGIFASAVHGLNRLPLPRLAVDLPSGLSGSRAELLGPHVQADLTVTFAAPKIAHVFPPAADAVGELVITDLGFPASLVEAAEGDLHLLTAEDLAACRLSRQAAAHKGDFGHVLVVAGSPGKSGAAVLAARAAVRAGAGLVTAAVPAPLLHVVDGGSVESMTLALSAGEAGELAAAAEEEILAAAEERDVVALGPGLGQGEEVQAVIRAVVRRCPRPLVLDADGLNAFAGRLGELAELAERGQDEGGDSPAILTPHPGELGRLLGSSSGEVQKDRLAAVRRAAAESRCLVLLKGQQSLVATPEGEVWVNPTGNAGMATGGTGDVLTGIIAGLLAQGYEALTAARLGVWLHGRAGDLAAQRLGQAGMAAGDLLEELPAADRELASGRNG